MSRLLLAGLTVLFATTVAPADEKKADAPKLTGTWVKESDGITLSFQFLADGKLKANVKLGDAASIEVSAKYAVDKAGRVTMTVTDVATTGDAQGKPDKGKVLKFTWKATGKTAALSDFEGDSDEAKKIVEGEYKLKGEK